MKPKIISILLLLIIAFSTVTLSGCWLLDNDSEDGGDSSIKPPPSLWNCEYSIDNNGYDLDCVDIVFTYGYRNFNAKREFYNSYLKNQGYNDNTVESILSSEEYPPITVYLSFVSFGNRYLIKTIEDFFSEEYLGKNHNEKIIIPKELFYNDYGLIKFEFSNTQNGEDNLFANYHSSPSCDIYYKKVNEKVYVSDKDFAQPYQYHIYKLYPNHEENTVLKGFWNNDPNEQDYCAIVTSSVCKVSDIENYTVDFFMGRIYDSTIRNVAAVDVIVIGKSSNNETVEVCIKTISDYMSDQYLCTRMHDYYGKIREIIFSHKEKIKIAKDFFVGELGEIELCIRDTNKQEIISSLTLTYNLKKGQWGDDSFLIYHK